MSGSSPAGGEGHQRGSLGTLRASIESRASEQQPEGTLRVPIREAGLISLRAFGQTALGLRRAGLPPITLPRAVALDCLRFFVVDLDQLVSCLAVGPEQLVELGMNGLCVAVLGTLDEQSHEPRGDGCRGVPIKRVEAQCQPDGDVGEHRDERGWMRGQNPELRQPLPPSGRTSTDR
jgi:hypothetical protein